MQEQFASAQKLFDDAVVRVVKLDTLATLVGSMAGFDSPKLWMFVFQNSAEYASRTAGICSVTASRFPATRVA